MSHDVLRRVLGNSTASKRATQEVRQLTARTYANTPTVRSNKGSAGVSIGSAAQPARKAK